MQGCIRYTAIILLLFWGIIGNAQIKVIDQKGPLPAKQNRIPIRVLGNQIIVPLEFKYGLKLNFIFDSGVNNTIITDPFIVDLLELNVVRDIKVRGYGREEPLPAFIADNLNYRLNDDFVFSQKPVVVLKEALNMSDYMGESIFGLIGGDILKEYRVEIDYNNEYLKLSKHRKPIKSKRYLRKDISIVNGKPYTDITIEHDGRKEILQVLLDTGFSGALSLYPKDINNPFKTEPSIDNYRGNGINGAITSTLKLFDKLQFAGKPFKNVTVNFLDSASMKNFNPQNVADGGVGSEILKRYRVIFDYENKKVYLKKNRQFGNPFNYNIAGLRIKATDKEKAVLVENVRPESPASKAGLLENDYLISVDNKRVRNLRFDRIYGLLNDEKDPNKRLTVKRNDEIITLELFIQDVF